MFSQLRNAVEHLAQQAVPLVSDVSSPDHNSAEPTRRTGSLDMHALSRSVSPPSDLAESALSSLRKSLSQRSTATTQGAKTPSPAPPENTRPRKSNLEERLRRAAYATTDSASASNSSRPSRVASPSPMGANRRPMPKSQEQSAYSTPLPASPMVAPASDNEVHLTQPSSLSLDEKTAPSESKLKSEITPGPFTEEPSAVQSSPISDAKLLESGMSSDASGNEPQPTRDSIKAESVSKEDNSSIDVQSSTFEEIHTHSTSTETTTSLATFAIAEEEHKSDMVQLGASPNLNEVRVQGTPPTTEPVPSKEGPIVEEGLSEDEELSVEKDLFHQMAMEETLIKEESSVKTEPLVQEDSPVKDDPPLTIDSSIKETSVAEDKSAINEDLPAQEDSPIGQLPQAKDNNSALEDHLTVKEDLSIDEDLIVKESLPKTSPVAEDLLVAEEASTREEKGELKHSAAFSLPDTSNAEVESLQARLKQVEQRFADVSTSFKRLQAEKLAADSVLRELSPLESINDVDALREFFNEHKAKEKMFQDEIKRLNQKLELQDDRFEEMRDTHRLESRSRSDEVTKIRTQLDETEALFQAAQRATTNAEQVVEKRQEEITQLQKEVEKSKNIAKEEEEKRVKAISLLKTVRQKLVKAEKDKEDSLKELNAVREREKGEKDKELADRMNFQQEIENLNTSHEKSIANVKAQSNRDLASMRERYEQEISALRGQSALDLASAKNTYTKELGAKTSQITTLENSLNNVSRDKNAFFDQLQLRQAELESAQAHLESLQHQNAEFQFQLRESNDRLSLLKEEASELVREQQNRSRDPVTSADEIARMVSAAEAKYESRLSEMKRNLAVLEKERYESEADWSRKLKEKVKELEDLKRVLGSAARSREEDEGVVAKLKADLQQARDKIKTLDRQISELPVLREQIHELEKTLKEQDQEASVKILVLEKQVEETKTREAQMKQSNKTLREELRKVQSSAALLERQRNPGVGYWTTRIAEGNGSAEPRTPTVSSPTVSSSRASSPAPSSTPSNTNEEEVNLEYLRNVILQFLEHKEMRPNLVKVLSIILHFTPQETRRLIAKV